MDNLNTLDNVSKNTHTKLFKSQFSGASGNKAFALRQMQLNPHFVWNKSATQMKSSRKQYNTEIANHDIIYN